MLFIKKFWMKFLSTIGTLLTIYLQCLYLNFYLNPFTFLKQALTNKPISTKGVIK